MGVYADIKTDLLQKINYYQQIKDSLLGIKDDSSGVVRQYSDSGYKTTTDKGLKGFIDNWRTENPTSDGSGGVEDQDLYNLWQFCQGKTEDELYALASDYDSIIASFNTDLTHIQKIIDNGEDPAGVE